MPGLPDFRDAWQSGGNPVDNTPDIPGRQTIEELARNGRNSTTQERRECPKCGEEYGNLPPHLRTCNGGQP